jgi:hypothetical protein
MNDQAMPPLRTNYSKRRLPPAKLNEEIQEITQILSPDVNGQIHELLKAYRRLRTVRNRDAYYLILNEWKKHGDETKLSHFMTEKIAELIKRGEQQEKNSLRKYNVDIGPEYRTLATDYLQSNFPPEALAQIVKNKARLKEVGSDLFKKCDADILAKCPKVFASMEEVIKWRWSSSKTHNIKNLILKALPSDFNQTLSPHSAGESALESLAHAAALAADRDRSGTQSGEPQDAGGSNCGYQDMGNFEMHHNASLKDTGSTGMDLLLSLSVEMPDASEHGINGASEAGECRQDGSSATPIAAPTPARREGGLPFAAEGTDVGSVEERRGYWAADTTEGDLPSLLWGLTHLTASKLAGGRQRSES